MSGQNEGAARPPLVLPARLALTAATWQAAAVIAGLRVASNDAVRTRRRDQGPAGNVRNDVMGVAAELIGRNALERVHAPEPVRGTLLDPSGAVDDVDATFVDADGRTHRIEVKGHQRESRYTRFAINDTAHSRSIQRGATGYLGVLFAPASQHAIISRLVPVADVSGWSVVELNPRRRDPARVIALQDFRRLYTSHLDVLPTVPRIVSWQDLERGAEAARRRLPHMRGRTPPQLQGTSAGARDWGAEEFVRYS